MEKKFILNTYDCGCIVHHDGAGAHLIKMCSTHKAAPDLLEALEYVRRTIEKNQIHDWFDTKIINNAINKALK